MESKQILPVEEGYDRWAPFYDSEENPLIAVEAAEARRLLGDVGGKTVADLGCGTGRHALSLANAGAQVTALDFSAGMLARAQEKPGAERVRWLVHDLSQPLPLESRSYDRVLCALALEHVVALDAVFREMERICRPQGRVIVTEMHPALLLKGVSAHFHDPETGQDIRPRSAENQISDFVTAALRARLELREMSERWIDDALVERHPRTAKHRGWPLLLAFAFVRRADV